ncbi:MAG: shikimate kinase [Minisyncoccia bacterium]
MNISLIGMSGVGKSFIGKQLASALGYECIDIDVRMEKRFGKSLQEILDEFGDTKFILEEEREVLNLTNINRTIFAPGGSVIYSPKAMDMLKSISKIIYLSAPSEWIKERTDPSARGIVGLRNRSFEELYVERQPLYERYADVRIDVSEKDFNTILFELKTILAA